jgi:hypothetical protein
LYISTYTLLVIRREDKRFWRQRYQAFPNSDLLLIPSWMQFWFVSVILKYLNFDTFSKALLAILMLRFCPAFRSTYTYLVFPVFASRTTSSLASISFCVLLYGIYVELHETNNMNINQKQLYLFNFNTTLFSWTFLKLYSKAELKSNYGKPSPCIRRFWIWNKYWLVWTLLWVSLKHILISLNSFLDIRSSMRVLYNISLSTELYYFLKSTNSWYAVFCILHYLTNAKKKTWSLVDLLCWNPLWWSLIISSSCGVNIEKRILNKMLCGIQIDNILVLFYTQLLEWNDQ